MFRPEWRVHKIHKAKLCLPALAPAEFLGLGEEIIHVLYPGSSSIQF